MRASRALTMMTGMVAVLAISTAPGVSYAAASANNPAYALNSVADGLVQQAIPSASDVGSAAVTAAADVPFDPSKGVTLRRGGLVTVVGLPDADHLSQGTRQSSGVVTYHNPNGSDTVVVPTSNGAQFLTIIENANAPESYAYPLTLSAGQTVQVTSSGYALVLDSAGRPVSSIAAPWAQGGGNAVETSFTTDGTTLVQHIAHKASGTSYPVVADPNYAWYSTGVVITFNKWDTGAIGASAAFTAVWVAAATLTGQEGNKLYQSIWYIQAVAAYDGAVGQCLWVWVPRGSTNVSAGGYRC